jgi:hypothetical protein
MHAAIELLLETMYFLCGPSRDIITREVGVMGQLREFCMEGCEERT